MKPRIIALIAVLAGSLASTSVFASADRAGLWDGLGGQVGNGIYVLSPESLATPVYERLSQFIDAGIVYGQGEFSADELALLRKIGRSLTHKPRARVRMAPKAKFKAPGELYYLVITDSKQGSDLWLNRDFINEGMDRDLSLSEASNTLASLLIEGLALQLGGRQSAEDLDRMAETLLTVLNRPIR